MAQWRLDQRRVRRPLPAWWPMSWRAPGRLLPRGAGGLSCCPQGISSCVFSCRKTAFHGMHAGDRYALRRHARPADLTGSVSFISPQAEYTPPVNLQRCEPLQLISG